MFKRKTVRKHIRFYGLVQAVGFRYHARNAASLYGTTGWVRNEYDGSVSMEIQGTEDRINSVLSALENDSYIRIYNKEVSEIPLENDERSFRVVY